MPFSDEVFYVQTYYFCVCVCVFIRFYNGCVLHYDYFSFNVILMNFKTIVLEGVTLILPDFPMCPISQDLIVDQTIINCRQAFLIQSPVNYD